MAHETAPGVLKEKHGNLYSYDGGIVRKSTYLESLESLHICPAFANFKFNDDNVKGNIY